MNETATATEERTPETAAVDELLERPATRHELAARQMDASTALALSETIFTEDRRAQVAAFIGVDPANTALPGFFAIAAQLGLNPFTGEIWLIETRKRGKDGEGWISVHRPAVGRDGLLKVARREPAYQGFQADVVAEHDEFTYAYTGRADDPQVLHRQSKPAGSGEDWRGKVIGAWCKVYVEGQKPTFYYAPMKEHAQVGEKDGERYLKGAWSYVSTMILKAAVSYCHRLAIGVSGFVPVDEMLDGKSLVDTDVDAETVATELPDETAVIADLELPEELRKELTEKARRANELSPFSWAASKLEMRLSGVDEAAARQVLEEIERDIENDEKRDAAFAEARAEADAEQAEAVDAKVVVRAEDLEPRMIVEIDGETDVVEEVGQTKDGVDPPLWNVVLRKGGPSQFSAGAEFDVVGSESDE